MESLVATPSLLSRVIESQGQDAEIVSIRDRVQSGIGDEGWTIHADGSLWYRGRVVVPQLTDLRDEILSEFHYSRFAVHPGGTNYSTSRWHKDVPRSSSPMLLDRDEETCWRLYSTVSHLSIGKG